MERSLAWRIVCAAGYGVVLLAAHGLLFSPVQAQKLRTTVGISVKEEFTDNANHATKGEKRHSDLITSVTPRISFRGDEGGRNFNLDYSLGSSAYKVNDSEGNRFQNTLSATGHVEIWDRIAFLDARASVSQQRTEITSASTDSQAGQRINRSEVRTASLSPYLLHHFGTWVETQSRLNLSKVTSDSGAADTVTRGESFTAKSGRRFSQYKWAFSLNEQKTSRSDSSPANRSSRSNADFTYVVGPKVSLLFGGGYEKIEDGTLDDEPSGLTWNVGVNLRPGRRTSLRATYGNRFDSDVVTVNASHQLSTRTSISATFSETIQTSQQAITEDTSFIGTDAEGNLIDTRTGLPFVAGNENFGFTTNTFRQKRFSTQISGSRRRNSFSGQIFWESRKTDATGIEEIVRGGNVTLGRKLTRRLSGNLRLKYTHTDFGTADSRFAKDLSVSAGFNYTIFKDISGNLNYIHTRRVDHVGGSGMHENAITVGLNKTF